MESLLWRCGLSGGAGEDRVWEAHHSLLLLVEEQYWQKGTMYHNCSWQFCALRLSEGAGKALTGAQGENFKNRVPNNFIV